MSRRIGSVFGAISVLALVGCSGSSDAPSPGDVSSGGSSAAGASNSGAGTSNAGQPSIAEANLPQTAASAIPQDSLSLAVKANNALAVDLYAHLLADAPPGNVLTSPISASLALTMTYAGAVGDTATQMAQALHFDPSAGSAIFDGQNALSQALAARGASAFAQALQNAQYSTQPAPVSTDYDLHIVNSVWGEKTYTWQQPFLATLAQSYGTGVYQEDFVNASETARLAINSWVSDQTKDKINNLLPMGALDTNTRMVLVNALHLKFPWASPFTLEGTVAGAFTRGDGSTVSASFMNQTTNFPYVDDGQAQIVALPLASKALSLVVALPHAGVDLASYEGSLSANSAALGEPTTGALVALSLPKATFTSPSFTLADALKAMGMTNAFDRSSADFSGLCAAPPGGPLFVSDVLQKTMISMQETGVEAAAATAVIVGTAAIAEPPPPPPVAVVVNRPYLVALVDGPTGAILMLGHVMDPTDAGSP